MSKQISNPFEKPTQSLSPNNNPVYLPQHEKWAQPRVLRNENNPYKDPGIDFTDDPGKTDQSQAEECDVNHILARFAKTGVLPGTDVQSVFEDVSDAPSYQESLNIVLQAQNQFASLDAQTRKKFDNDPIEFLKFVDDPKNAQELADLGLATISPPDAIERLETAIRASNSPSEPESDPAGGQPAPKTPKKAKA